MSLFAAAVYLCYVFFIKNDSTPQPTSTPARTFSPTHKPTPTPAPSISFAPTITPAPTTATPYPSPAPTIKADHRTEQPTNVVQHTYPPTDIYGDIEEQPGGVRTETGEGDGAEENGDSGAADQSSTSAKSGSAGGVRGRRMAGERPQVPSEVLDRERTRMRRAKRERARH